MAYNNNRGGGKRLPARGVIEQITLQDDREVVILSDGGTYAITYDPARRGMATVRANEIDSLEPFMPEIVGRSLPERSAHLTKIALNGGWVRPGRPDPDLEELLREEEEKVQEARRLYDEKLRREEEEIWNPPPDRVDDFRPVDTSQFVTCVDHKRDLDRLSAHTVDLSEQITSVHENATYLLDSMQGEIDALRVEVENLKPTVIQFNDAEPREVKGHVHKMLPTILRLLQRDATGKRRIPYLPGPAGSGKTTLAEQVGEALGLPVYIIPCHPMLTPAQLLGFVDAHGSYVMTDVIRAYDRNGEGGVPLFDEIDKSHPGLLAALNALLAQDSISTPGGVFHKHPDFIPMAAANTFGTGPDAVYVGSAQLDGATLNRFTMVPVDYDRDLERSLVEVHLNGATDAWCKKVWGIRDALAGERVIIGTRDLVEGAAMLAAGFTESEVLDMRVIPNLSTNLRGKIRSLV